MRYAKPFTMDLKSMAVQGADGEAFGCVSGDNTGLTSATCGTGGTAYGGCSSGSDPGTLESCTGGSSASGGDCLGGSFVGSAFYCEAGATGGNDPYGCTAGPSFVNG